MNSNTRLSRRATLSNLGGGFCLLLGVVCLASAHGAAAAEDEGKYSRAIKAVEDAGGKAVIVEHPDGTVETYCNLKGESDWVGLINDLPNVTHLRLSGSSLLSNPVYPPPESVTHLKIKLFDDDRDPAKGDRLRFLDDFTELTSFEIECGGEITDQDFSDMSFTGLETLSISNINSGFTRRQLRQIGSSESILDLRLTGELPGNGLGDLRKLTNLKSLTLHYACDDGPLCLEGIEAFQELETLCIQMTEGSFRDADVEQLAALPALTFLDITTFDISLEQAESLSKSTSLRRVALPTLRVDDTARDRLRQLRPNVRVESYGPLTDRLKQLKDPSLTASCDKDGYKPHKAESRELIDELIEILSDNESYRVEGYAGCDVPHVKLTFSDETHTVVVWTEIRCNYAHIHAPIPNHRSAVFDLGWEEGTDEGGAIGRPYPRYHALLLQALELPPDVDEDGKPIPVPERE